MFLLLPTGSRFQPQNPWGSIHSSGAWIMQLPLSMSLARISKLRSSVLFSAEVKASTPGTRLRCSPLEFFPGKIRPKKNNAATIKTVTWLQEILFGWVVWFGIKFQFPLARYGVPNGEELLWFCHFVIFWEVLMVFKGFRPKRSTEVEVGIWNPRLIWCHYLVLNGFDFFVQQINNKYHHYHQHQLTVKTWKTVHELTFWLASTYMCIGFLPSKSTSPPFCRMFLIASSALKGEVANNKKVGKATVIWVFLMGNLMDKLL